MNYSDARHRPQLLPQERLLYPVQTSHPSKLQSVEQSFTERGEPVLSSSLPKVAKNHYRLKLIATNSGHPSRPMATNGSLTLGKRVIQQRKGQKLSTVMRWWVEEGCIGGWEPGVVAPRGEALLSGQGVLRFILEVMIRM